MNRDRLEEEFKRRVKRALAERRGYRIRELTPENFLFNNEPGAPRINLVVPWIQSSVTFGGISTALRFFNALRKRFPRSRIVVTDEQESDFEAAKWPGWVADTRRNESQTVAYLKKAQSPLVIDGSDYFIATHWLTAHFLKSIAHTLHKEGKQFNQFIYFIQDFEPGFYPWSSRYLLANSTYENSADYIAVFNTGLLCEYFERAGYAFPTAFTFEPCLNPALAVQRSRLNGHKKQKLLLVYGRPDVERNAFELIVETLHSWVRQYSKANQWRVLSLGRAHGEIVLSTGIKLQSKGKVSIDEYANYLLDAAVGLSLMVSPHPSYPPLEMADFGVQVVTNRFANKDLSVRSPNIVSLSEATPHALSEALIRCCENHEAGNVHQASGSAFWGTDDEFPFMTELFERLIPS